jgi:hypothetical protein
MKKVKTLAAILLTVALAKFSTAQIYMTSTGNVSIGTTAAPPSTGVILFNMGPALFSSVVPATLLTHSAPLIMGTNGYSTATGADYTWWYDGGTGMYHPAQNTIGFTANTTNVLTLSPGNARFNSGVSVWGGSYLIYSDQRLKENIKTITSPLDKVMQLRGVTFNYIADKDNTSETSTTNNTQIGVIAQEVEKVVPEAVRTGADGYKGVAYQNLVGLLIEAIKAEKNSIDSLKTQLNNCCAASQGSSSSQNYGSLSAAILYQNVPNPFSQNTTISCVIPDNANSHSLMIFNMNGGLVKTIPVDGTGTQSIVISGSSLTAGMYYYTLVVDGKEVDTKKMILTQ